MLKVYSRTLAEALVGQAEDLGDPRLSNWIIRENVARCSKNARIRGSSSSTSKLLANPASVR